MTKYDGRGEMINLRASQRQKLLIDRAAELLGRTRSDFMLETACRERPKLCCLTADISDSPLIRSSASQRCSTSLQPVIRNCGTSFRQKRRGRHEPIGLRYQRAQRRSGQDARCEDWEINNSATVEAVASASTEGSFMTTKTLDQHIETSLGVAGGKARIAGHRITVRDIVIWHERLGKSVDEIASDYGLTLADVHAALAYYFDHRADIDKDMADGQAFAESIRQVTPSKLKHKLNAGEN